MKRIIAALVLVAAAAIGLNIGLDPDDVRRIMETPEYQQELARRTP